jgi:hypothetical protein
MVHRRRSESQPEGAAVTRGAGDAATGHAIVHSHDTLPPLDRQLQSSLPQLHATVIHTSYTLQT